jgi:hypothetical protein
MKGIEKKSGRLGLQAVHQPEVSRGMTQLMVSGCSTGIQQPHAHPWRFTGGDGEVPRAFASCLAV